jgi:integrase
MGTRKNQTNSALPASKAKDGKKAAELTPGEAIKKMMVGQFVTLNQPLAHGALQARKLASGVVTFYWRYAFDGKRERVKIGPYDSALPPKTLTHRDGRWTIAAAAAEAERLAYRHDDAKEMGGHAGLERAKAEQLAKELAEAAAEQACIDAEQARQEQEAQHRRQFTLQALLVAYCDNLKRLERGSHRDALGIITNHVIQAWPELAGQPANEVTDEQITDMLRRLVDMGKARTANKLRAYVRAAYETARKARNDAKVPVAFKQFNIRTNPAADTAANTEANRADKRPLSADELRAYWLAIKDIEGIKGAALKLHLLTGGQRIEQLVRLKSKAVTPNTITLLDGKGRPGSAPRVHVLPLTTQAAEVAQTLDLSGDFALSTEIGERMGVTHVANTTLAAWAAAAAGDTIKNFSAKRVRSGVETLLASLGFSQEVRGRLQSHGITGVQAKHYDGHDYLPEKRAALEALYQSLTTTAANVRPIKAA